MIPDEKSHGSGTQRKSGKQKMSLFRRLWVKDPNHSEEVSDEKRCPYRSIRLTLYWLHSEHSLDALPTPPGWYWPSVVYLGLVFFLPSCVERRLVSVSTSSPTRFAFPFLSLLLLLFYVNFILCFHWCRYVLSFPQVG